MSVLWDIRSLKNERGQRLGLLFVFSGAALEVDLLTGFQDWEGFRLFVREAQNAFHGPVAVAVRNINSLPVINSTVGNHVGDQQIKSLADTTRQCFPKQACYVRGPEASLFALRSHGSEAGDCPAQVKERFPGQSQYASAWPRKKRRKLGLRNIGASRTMSRRQTPTSSRIRSRTAVIRRMTP